MEAVFAFFRGNSTVLDRDKGFPIRKWSDFDMWSHGQNCAFFEKLPNSLATRPRSPIQERFLCLSISSIRIRIASILSKRVPKGIRARDVLNFPSTSSASRYENLFCFVVSMAPLRSSSSEVRTADTMFTTQTQITRRNTGNQITWMKESPLAYGSIPVMTVVGTGL